MVHTALTLICNPKAPSLDESVHATTMRLLQDWALAAPEPVILCEGVATDFVFQLRQPDTPTTALRRQLEALFSHAAIDIALQPADCRAKSMLIADMDSTMIEQECIDELAAFVGKRDEISAITERAMRGELDFDGALRERVSMLRGLPLEKLQEAFDECISFTPGGTQLVKTMRARGAYTALVSGGFTFFTERVAAHLGFDEHQANTLIDDGTALSGTVGEPILGRAAKEEALKRITATRTIPLEKVVAVGDGANDLSMLGTAGTGVAFHAKPAVSSEADIRIDHGDLTALLYMQGLSAAQFVQ